MTVMSWTRLKYLDLLDFRTLEKMEATSCEVEGSSEDQIFEFLMKRPRSHARALERHLVAAYVRNRSTWPDMWNAIQRRLREGDSAFLRMVAERPEQLTFALVDEVLSNNAIDQNQNNQTNQNDHQTSTRSQTKSQRQPSGGADKGSGGGRKSDRCNHPRGRKSAGKRLGSKAASSGG